MTGRPAETWRRFTFSTPPAWTYALLALVCIGVFGLLIAAAIIYLVSDRASGHLPLTRSSKRLADLTFWISIALIVASPIAWIIAFVLGSIENQSPIFPIFFLLGMALLLAGVLGRFVCTPLINPRGKVFPVQPGQYDRVVQISNVRMPFVLAVRQHQQLRYAQAHSRPAPQPLESK